MLLKSLVALNYLDYEPTARRFVPTYRVTLLGNWIQASRYESEAITVRPMTLSAVGQILLGQKTNTQVKAIIRRNNADVDNASQRVKESEFLKEIELIRERGYAESRGKMTPGANVIAMLAPNDGNSPLLAIGIGGPMPRIDQRRKTIIEVMRQHLDQK